MTAKANTPQRLTLATIPLLLALLIASSVSADPVASETSIQQIHFSTHYVSAGDSISGTVVFSRAINPLLSTRITLFKQVDVPTNPKVDVGFQSLNVAYAAVTTGTEIPFKVEATDMLAGSLRVQAQLFAKDGAVDRLISEAWSNTIQVDVRKQISLAGEWQVTDVEPYPFRVSQRPKDWAPPHPQSVTLPGAMTNDEWFRGWMTLKRDVSWTSQRDGLQPRFLHLSEIHDSAAVTIDGTPLRETRPLEEMAVLTHWVEFHSEYKGEENAKTRLMFLDLLPQPPVKLALPRALPEAGKTTVQIRLRGSSGLFRTKPAYGIAGDLDLQLTPPQYVKSVTFDTEKPGPMRRFHFNLILGNDSDKPFTGTLRAVYRRYDGKIAYTGGCREYASESKPITLKPGENTFEVIRDEYPRFETCRATFFLQDAAGKVLDADGIDFHTVTFEIRDRRDFYLNNERFIVKGQGSAVDTAAKRWQLKLMGGNALRGPTDPDQINILQSEGLLTSCGGALLASVEKCAFYNPADTSNVTKAVSGFTSVLSQCPGILIWEATNELHGEPEEARVAILEAFHKLDPYHRPVLATKGSGEWEAEAHSGRVKGVDIVGCQYLLSKEAIDSVTSAVTEQPIMSTEVNWNDGGFGKDNLWQYWLSKGVAGSLLFDYSGGALDQPAPTVPPNDTNISWSVITRANRDLYQDLIASAEQQADRSVRLKIANQMPYAVHSLSVRVRGVGGFETPDLQPGAAAVIVLPSAEAPPPREVAVVRAEYRTHGGLPHVAILTPTVVPATSTSGVAK